MTTGEDTSGAKRLRKVAKMWYRADHAAANAGCALIAGYPAGLLRHHRVAAGAIASGTVSGGDLVVAWANAWGYLLEPGEDLHADRARAVLLAPGGSYRCTLEFAPDNPDAWFVPPMYQTGTPRRAACVGPRASSAGGR